jgi:hypothetical protein
MYCMYKPHGYISPVALQSSYTVWLFNLATHLIKSPLSPPRGYERGLYVQQGDAGYFHFAAVSGRCWLTVYASVGRRFQDQANPGGPHLVHLSAVFQPPTSLEGQPEELEFPIPVPQHLSL